MQLNPTEIVRIKIENCISASKKNLPSSYNSPEKTN